MISIYICIAYISDSLLKTCTMPTCFINALYIERESERQPYTQSYKSSRSCPSVSTPPAPSPCVQSNNIRSYLEQFFARFCNLLQNCQRENDVTQMKCNSNKRGKRWLDCGDGGNLLFRVATWHGAARRTIFISASICTASQRQIASGGGGEGGKGYRISRRKERNFF